MENKNLEIKEYKEIDDETIQILASDESLDRDNDIIKVNGWSFSNWLKTGALLYGHQPHELPVGSAEGAEIRGKKFYVYSKLAKKGTSEWHDAIRSLVDQKILKGVSVGFKVIDYEDNEFGGRTFKEQELLEVSLTPIPANANARLLVKEYSKEIQEKLIPQVEVKLEQIDEILKEDLVAQTDEVQDEAQDAEPEQKTSDDRAERLLKVVSDLKKLIGG